MAILTQSLNLKFKLILFKKNLLIMLKYLKIHKLSNDYLSID